MCRRKWKLFLLFPCVFLPSQNHVLAQSTATPEYREEPPFDLKAASDSADWKAVVTAAVEPQREFEADEGPSQSRICFARKAPGANECTYFRDLFHSNLTFQVFSSLTIERLESAGGYINGVALQAAGWYPTGQIHETAIWVHDTQGDDWRLVLAVESSELRIVSDGPFDGVLVTSNWHRDEGEAKWDEHRRDITVYRFSIEGGQPAYRKVFNYTTALTYEAEDTDTIDAEWPNIRERLR